MAQRENKITRYDGGVIAALLLTALLGSFLFARGTAAAVLISVDGKPYASCPITEDKIIVINTRFGHNTVVIENGAVRVTEADCKDRLDIKAGAISRPNQMLVCLPNRVVVRIAGKGNVDVVAY